MSTTPRANGGALRALMERWRGEPALDAAFEAEVLAVDDLAVDDSASEEQDADAAPTT